MFLLRSNDEELINQTLVFVSYIRRYVLTVIVACIAYVIILFSSPIFGDMFLLLFDQLVDISTIIDIFNGTLNGQ